MRLIDATPEVCEPYLYDNLDDLNMIAAQNAIDDMPTVDAVPVCRCKDCDMWNEEDFSGRKSLGNYRCACAEWSNMEDGRRVYTGPDEFCSRGERMDGGANDADD